VAGFLLPSEVQGVEVPAHGHLLSPLRLPPGDFVTSAHRPPGPNGNLLWNFPAMGLLRADFLGFMQQMTDEHGPVWTAKIGAEQVALVNDAELAGEILAGRAGEFRRTRSQKRLIGMAVGDGLILSDGEFWRRQRKLAQPAFHHARIVKYLETMIEVTDRHVEGWPVGGAFDFGHAMMALTLEIVGATLLGAQATRDLHVIEEAVGEIQRGITRLMRLGIPVPEWLPTPSTRRIRRGVAALDRIIYPLIESRRADGTDHGDLLSMLLLSEDADDPSIRMSAKQVRDEVATMFLAGHDTTSHLLTWTLHLLGRHPEAFAAMQREVDQVLAGSAPTMELLKKLTWMDAVIRESLRLYPPVYIILREPAHDLELGGYLLRQGEMILVSPWMLQRDARNFDEPEAFQPERFADGASAGWPKAAYIPFGMGPHQCIGKQFAMMEAMVVLATICRRFDLAHVGAALTPDPLITLGQKGPLEVSLVARR